MRQIFKTEQTTNCKRVVVHTGSRTHSFLVSNFAEALELLKESGFSEASITHVDISHEKVDGINLEPYKIL
jgi:hypothetical protein